MVREVSNQVSVSLQCYQTLASLAYTGGGALNAGSDLAGTVVGLVQSAYAPLTLKADLPVAMRSSYAGTPLHSENSISGLGLALNSLSVQLPGGFHYIRKSTSGLTTAGPKVSGLTLSWALGKLVPAHGQLRLHFAVRTPRRTGAYTAHAVASVQTTASSMLLPRTPKAVLRVKRSINTVGFGFAGGGPKSTTVSGWANAHFAPRSGATSPVTTHGRVVVRTSHGRRLILRAQSLRLQKLAEPTQARLTLMVVSAPGMRTCATGSPATLTLTASGSLHPNGTSAAHLSLALGRACGGTIRSSASISVSDS